MMSKKDNSLVVTIVGSGLIGQSWAMIFAASNEVNEVRMFDADQKQLEKARVEMDAQIDEFEQKGCLRGPRLGSEQKKSIVMSSSLKDALEGSVYVQECIPERIELKKRLWSQIDEILSKNDEKINENLILATSTSTLLPSDISEGMKLKKHFIVAHPVNPPYFLPMVELVPSKWTSDKTRDEARKWMKKLGQVPVSLNRELPGFILNRLQYVLLNECWRLVASGVVSPDDLDAVMTEGLGMRLAVIGPMQSIHLNAEGTRSYVDRYGPIIHSTSSLMNTNVPDAWLNKSVEDRQQVDEVCDQMEQLFPLDQLEKLRRERDHRLARLAALKKELLNQ